MTGKIVTALPLICIASACLAATGAAASYPRFAVNSALGGVRIGESQTQVSYELGDMCLSGCVAHNDGCVLGIHGCIGQIFRYRLTGGYLRVGFAGKRVAYLEGTAKILKDNRGFGIGSHVPFGQRYGPYRWHVCDGLGDGYWRTVPATYTARSVLTELTVAKGAVTNIRIQRADLPQEGC